MLDVVTYIQRHLDPTLCLSLRLPRRHVRLLRDDRQRRGALDLPHACGQGGRSDGKLEIAPLANLPVIKDLVTDMTRVLRQVGARQGQFKGAATRHDDFARVEPESPQRQAPTPASNASAAASAMRPATSSAWRPDYLGPAALNRAWTLVNDVRDVEQPERLRAVAGDAGCHACHTQGSAAPSAARNRSRRRAAIAGLEAASRRGPRCKASCESDAARSRRGGPPLVLAAHQRDGARGVRARASRHDRLCGARRAVGGGDPARTRGSSALAAFYGVVRAGRVQSTCRSGSNRSCESGSVRARAPHARRPAWRRSRSPCSDCVRSTPWSPRETPRASRAEQRLPRPQASRPTGRS